MTIFENKKLERDTFRKLRDGISPNQRENVENNVRFFVDSFVKGYKNIGYIAIYWPLKNEVDLGLPQRVSFANNADSDIFVSIHANASRGKRRDINGLETLYYRDWRGRLLAKKIQKQILRVSPGSPDRGVKQGRFYVI